MTDLAILNEFTLAQVAWRALICRRPMALLFSMPVLPVLTGPMARLARWLLARGIMREPAAVLPALGNAQGSATSLAIASVYPRCEGDIVRHFAFDVRSARLGTKWAQAYRHCSMGLFKSHMQTLLTLRDVEPTLVRHEIRIFGLQKELLALYQAAVGHEPRFVHRRVPECRVAANVVGALAMLAAAVAAAIRAARGRKRHMASIDLAYDQPDNDAEGGAARLALAIVGGDAARVLFVFRNDFIAAARDPDKWRSLRCAAPSDGTLSVLEALRALGEAAADLARMLFVLGNAHPHHFLAMAKLTVKRIALRALLRRYAVRTFLGRDDYNTEHIVRSQELRRIGALSLGINHGLPTAPARLMHWQYLDFDIYYTFGRFLYDTWYHRTWSPRMALRPVGCWGMSRQQRARANQAPRRDIVYFANPLTDPMPLVQAAVRVAAAFPERTMWVKVKFDYPGADPRFFRYLRLAQRKLANFVPTYEDAYELILRSADAIGGLTTALPEAAQFGCRALFLDFYPREIEVLFRFFPDICVSSADAVIERIRQADAGSWEYPRASLEPLIAMNVDDPFAVIAADVAGRAPDAIRQAA